ncbi:hypothetical protein [Hansschlegelia beijingensis]|uniref:Uncharacterized protein n=1 Tax=Hansschlegelia beijingensis TaxID=1133344 RepID=A0A7W6GE53_9HYPH|nr:hypothetical protein [Hansschlegelia beijingensis]MBB3972511.1 hypothetical protein [Hansschlegelia beijingensis]
MERTRKMRLGLTGLSGLATLLGSTGTANADPIITPLVVSMLATAGITGTVGTVLASAITPCRTAGAVLAPVCLANGASR